MAYIPARLSSERWLIRFSIALAALFVAFGISDYTNPPVSFDGRWSWIPKLVFELFGPLGLLVLWLALAIVPLLVARFVWRHAPRVPSDRWYW